MKRTIVPSSFERVPFTKEMKENYTLLCPQMSPIHFRLLEPALRVDGFNIVMLPEVKSVVDTGLKYVNNDACYPSLIVVGQIMEALLSGRYDLNKTAVAITQTGGGCRATNYIGFIRRALKKAGMEQIPVVSISVQGLEKNEGMKYTLPMIIRAMHALIYGDLFMRVVYRTRPYEAVPGSVDALHKKWEEKCIKTLQSGIGSRAFNEDLRNIVKDFDTIPLKEGVKKPRVGIVGEILVKFLPAANNHLVELLEAEGAEAVMPDLLDFFLYCFYNSKFKAENLGAKKSTAAFCDMGIKFLEHMRKPMCDALNASKRFSAPSHIKHLAEMAAPFSSLGNQTGEGWFLTGEMLELIHSDVPNIVCTQPFGCLPNHIVGKGVIKELRHAYPNSNIIAVDYDPGASEVNQLNRIKLMLATAQKNIQEESKK